jgi:hypothetical protein
MTLYPSLFGLLLSQALPRLTLMWQLQLWFLMTNGKIIHATTKRLSTTETTIGEAQPTILVSQTVFFSCDSLLLEERSCKTNIIIAF